MITLIFTPFDLPAIFILGLIVGSFLNVVIYRYNTGRLWARGRSQCLACGKTLHWYELVPVFSFLIQRGKCAGCGSKISWQYPLVEFCTALAFVLVWQLPLPLFSKIIYLIIAAILVVIAAYDFRHLIIPDGMVYSFIALAFLNAILLSSSNLVLSGGNLFGDAGLLSVFSLSNFSAAFDWSLLANHVLTGLGLASFFWILWLVSRGKWLGFADGKLALGIGFLVGAKAGISALAFAFWSGAIIGLLLMGYSKLSRGKGRVTMKSELPFAPFLILGLILVTLFHLNVFDFFQI